jgi:ABC-2 type transport system permease protein
MSTRGLMSTLGALVRQRARRDRLQIAVWAVSTGLLALTAATGVARTYGDDAEREGIMRLAVANPSILLLRGLPQGAELPAFVFFQIFTYLALMCAFMAGFLAVRHSRAEEESGRAELVAATRAARALPTVATVIHGVAASVALGVAVALGFVAGGLPVAGALVSGAATTTVGVAFLGVGLLAAQLARTSRGANSIGAAAIGLAFLLRGVGDALGTPSDDRLSMTSAWPSWLSPIGWAQHTGAFTANDLAPLLLCLALAAVCIAAVFAVQASRDSGASLLPERAGRRAAAPWLSGSFALGWRLQWPSILGWTLGGAATGLLAGSLAGVVVEAARTNPELAATLRSIVPDADASVAQVLISAMFAIAGVVAAGCAIQTVIRLRQEETGGTAEPLLAARLGRVRWLADYLLLGVVAICLVLLGAALASAAGVLASGDDPARIADSFAAAAAQLPAALVYLGVLALVFVALPRATSGLGWALLAAGSFLGIFGALVGAPQWLRDVSPFSHTPVAVGTSTDWSGGAWLAAVAAAAASVALLLMRRRELR